VAPAPATPRWKHEEIALLRALAAAGAERTPVEWSSREVGSMLGVSQQAADRYLVHLAEAGLLQRSLGGRKQRLTLSPEGLELLRREYHQLRRIFDGPARLQTRGTVASGLGEGRYYLSQPGYVAQFAERLGYTPYPGTLNVRLAPADFRRLSAVRDWKGIRIDGFSDGGRTFGGATCHRAQLAGRACHLITPDRTHHTDVVEFIAPEFLREVLHLTDGDTIEVRVEET
jgi:riboflavin kinase